MRGGYLVEGVMASAGVLTAEEGGDTDFVTPEGSEAGEFAGGGFTIIGVGLGKNSGPFCPQAASEPSAMSTVLKIRIR